MMPVYYVLTGPTAAGKTGRLLSFAQNQADIPLAVVSADSRQVYRYMNIGTGKPTPSELKMLPHYGIDCLEPGIKYSAYQYLIDAAAGLVSAKGTGSLVWVCGGTGLYIRAVTESLELGAPPRPGLREALAAMFANESPRDVAARLGLELAEPDNPVRVTRRAEQLCGDPARASEIYELSGLDAAAVSAEVIRDSEHYSAAQRELAGWTCGGIYVLDPGKEILQERMALRIRTMFQSGLVEEVAGIRERGLGGADVVVDGIGYREAGAVLDGRATIEDAIASTIIRTRQYAKRQRTYFKGRGWPVVDDDGLTRVFRSIQ